LQLLLKQTNTGTFTTMTAETHWSTRTRLRALSRLLSQNMLEKITCAWSWRLCGFTPTAPAE